MHRRPFFWTRNLIVYSDLDRVAPIGFNCRLTTAFSIYKYLTRPETYTRKLTVDEQSAFFVAIRSNRSPCENEIIGTHDTGVWGICIGIRGGGCLEAAPRKPIHNRLRHR